MTSYRPDTSVPSTTSQPAAASADHERVTPSPASYVPNVSDLIFLAARAKDESQLVIPPGFLQSEAVDSSPSIGSGASFAVTRQRLPLTSQVSRHIAYKSARVQFEPNGAPSTAHDQRALLAVLTELHTLLHPTLRQHPNVISLLGLAWGSNHAEPSHRLPVLVVEYGDLGTLTDFQTRHPNLNLNIKTELCRGIACGLQALHDEGVVHGDVKPDNIIMCSDQNGQPIPKLADFGFSILESSAETSVHVGGTRTWRAPESFGPVSVVKLPLTDVYSFGLLVWSIAVDGKDPFRLTMLRPETPEEFLERVDRLKTSDEVLATSQLHKWFFQWMLDKGASESHLSINSSIEQPLFDQKILGHITKILETWKAGSPLMKQMILKMSESFPVWKEYTRLPFYKCLEPIFSCTLRKDPDRRDLRTAIAILEGGESGIIPGLTDLKIQSTENQSAALPGRKEASVLVNQINSNGSTRTEKRNAQDNTFGMRTDWYGLGFKHRMYSWQVMKGLEPSVQRFAANAMMHSHDPIAQFISSAFVLNAYGVGVDKKRAIDVLTNSAKAGYCLAQANLYRLVSVSGLPLPANVDILDYLKRHAVGGSRAALSDLNQLDPEAGKHCRKILDWSTGGVGALWYQPDQWLHGLNQGSFLDKDFRLKSLGTRSQLADIVVNQRGDRIIHAAAAVGAYHVVRDLLEDPKFDINQRNAQGETALLCACRASHPNIVLLLVSNCADASLSALNGETPLHWLSFFMPTVNPALVGKDLIDNGGAKVDAYTIGRVSHSRNFKHIDIDTQMPGTPLLWAVHDNNVAAVRFLLSRGADPTFVVPQGDGPSPLLWAAYFHRAECLKMMIEHIEKNSTDSGQPEINNGFHKDIDYKSLVKQAIRSADVFSMTLRNGVRCLNMLQSTLTYLQDKTLDKMDFWSEPEGLLCHAASGGHWEALRFMLDAKWGVEEINRKNASGGRTAVLEAVRWGTSGWFAELIKHGANPHVLSASPFDRRSVGNTWSALHVFANQGHEGEKMTLVDELLAAGLPVDGDPKLQAETPFNIAVRRKAFKLADHLRSRDAAVDALSIHSSLLDSPHPFTGLGHLIALNARHSTDSLRYMLRSGASFIVDPERNMSALHLCAVVPDQIDYIFDRDRPQLDFDWTTNRNIAYELLQHFRAPEELDRRVIYDPPVCSIPGVGVTVVNTKAVPLGDWMERGRTALHLAAAFGNENMVELLVGAGADNSLVWWNDYAEPEAAIDIATRHWSHDPDKLAALTRWLS